ncbi:MAG: UDP-glucose 4-epimerase GalE [Erysipelotrichaceae bacterium]
MSKILLTGGLGYIGSHCAVKLLQDGHDVVIIDNLYNSKIDALDNIRQITALKPSFYQIDCCDEKSLAEVFEKEGIEAVIHLAGYKAVGQSVSDPLMYYQNNLNATITLLKVMDSFKVNKLVFSSSATVYENQGTMEKKEQDRLWCTNPYGFTKLFSEQIIRDYSSSCCGFSAINLRYFNPIGAHPSALIGEEPNGIPNNLMPYITQVAVGKLPVLKIYGNDYDTVDGTGMRDYLHVMDLACAHVAAIDYLLSKQTKGCDDINIGTGKSTSVLQLVQAFEKVNGIEIPYVFEPRRAGDIADIYANTAKAKAVLHWESKYTIEDMCRDAYRWQLNLQKKR